MLKRIMVILFLILFFMMAMTQDKINASSIIKQIDNGEDISYKNCVILGDLNFTSVKDTVLKRKSFSLFKKYKEYLSEIKVKIKFENCLFQGSVLAYLHTKSKNSTYNVNFLNDAEFKSCIFKKESEFKHVRFEKKGNFFSCEFNKDANFKYTKFFNNISFSDCKFKNEANFKYTKFQNEVDFSKSIFQEYANFKYTKFKNNSNFTKVIFEDVNMKYTKFYNGKVIFDGTKFKGELNSKYCKINGTPLKRILLSNNI